MARGREKDEQKAIAKERVGILFDQAEVKALEGDLESASRRVRQAYDICLRCNVRLPRLLRLRFCRKCLTYFTSSTLQCRLDSESHRMSMKCLKCGHRMYQPYVRKNGKR